MAYPQGHGWSTHLSSLGHEPIGGCTTNQCDARPTVIFPAAEHKSPLDGAKYTDWSQRHIGVNRLLKAIMREEETRITSPSSLPYRKGVDI